MYQKPSPAETDNLAVYAMREKPGVMVIGKHNLGQKDVLRNIEDFLDDFYDANCLSFMMLQPEKFPLTESRKIPAVALEQKSQEEVVTNANISIIYYGNSQTLNPRDKNADYPVARSFSAHERFGVYFYVKDEKGNFDGKASIRQRDKFIERARANPSCSRQLGLF